MLHQWLSKCLSVFLYSRPLRTCPWIKVARLLSSPMVTVCPPRGRPPHTCRARWTDRYQVNSDAKPFQCTHCQTARMNRLISLNSELQQLVWESLGANYSTGKSFRPFWKMLFYASLYVFYYQGSSFGISTYCFDCLPILESILLRVLRSGFFLSDFQSLEAILADTITDTDHRNNYF